MSRLRTWALNGTLLGLSLCVVLAIAEVAIRIIAPQPTGLSHQDRYGLALHYPGITRFLPQYGHDVSFNRAGMRDREHALEKPAGTYRILLMGDSFMEGLQVPYDSLLAARLERALGRQDGRQVEVINAGVSGWGQDDELRYLTEYGLKYHPDLVLVAMTLHNDIGDNLRQQWHALKDSTLVTQPVQPKPFIDYALIQAKAFVATRFQLYQLWRRVRHSGEIQQITRNLNTHVVQLFRLPPSEKIATGMILTEKLLGAIRDTTRASGGQVAVVLLPLKHQLSDSAFADFVKTAEVPPAEMQFDRPQQQVTAMGQRLGIPVIDLLPEFRDWTAHAGAPLYLEWDGHWNSGGHALASTITARGLLARGLLGTLPVATDSVPHQ